MRVIFLTPSAAAFAVLALVPLAVYVRRQRRARRIRSALGLREPSRLSRLPLAVAIVAVPALLALAASQPVLESTRVRPERTDAEAFVVLDTSRSMLAAAAAGEPTRYERAQRFAEQLRADLPAVPIGLASLTDRVLPHVFPTTDAQVFRSALDDTIGIERPPPALFYSQHATSLDALGGIPRRKYFSPDATKRLLVVLTDGESRPLEGVLAREFDVRPRIETIFVHVWAAGERIYETGELEDGYRPVRASEALLARAASEVDGRVFAEAQTDAARDAARRLLGTGPTRQRKLEGQRVALMPYVTLAVLLPLGLVLVRRNL